MKDPFENVKIIWEFYDDINFFPRKESEEVQKVVERYIKKTKPKIYRLSTDNKSD
jgi:hypothetical protein